MDETRTILVTGATGSIGRAAARALARRGHRVVLVGRRPAKLREEVAGIEAELRRAAFDPCEGNLQTLVIDFADLDSVRRGAQRALELFPRIDGLVLSVGAILQDGPRLLPNGHEAMFAANVGEPLAELVALRRGRRPINGALFKLYHQVVKPDAAMQDVEGGRRLWEALARMTASIGSSPRAEPVGPPVDPSE